MARQTAIPFIALCVALAHLAAAACPNGVETASGHCASCNTGFYGAACEATVAPNPDLMSLEVLGVCSGLFTASIMSWAVVLWGWAGKRPDPASDTNAAPPTLQRTPSGRLASNRLGGPTPRTPRTPGGGSVPPTPLQDPITPREGIFREGILRRAGAETPRTPRSPRRTVVFEDEQPKGAEEPKGGPSPKEGAKEEPAPAPPVVQHITTYNIYNNIPPGGAPTETETVDPSDAAHMPSPALRPSTTRPEHTVVTVDVPRHRHAPPIAGLQESLDLQHRLAPRTSPRASSPRTSSPRRRAFLPPLTPALAPGSTSYDGAAPPAPTSRASSQPQPAESDVIPLTRPLDNQSPTQSPTRSPQRGSPQRGSPQRTPMQESPQRSPRRSPQRTPLEESPQRTPLEESPPRSSRQSPRNQQGSVLPSGAGSRRHSHDSSVPLSVHAATPCSQPPGPMAANEPIDGDYLYAEEGPPSPPREPSVRLPALSIHAPADDSVRYRTSPRPQRREVPATVRSDGVHLHLHLEPYPTSADPSRAASFERNGYGGADNAPYGGSRPVTQPQSQVGSIARAPYASGPEVCPRCGSPARSPRTSPPDDQPLSVWMAQNGPSPADRSAPGSTVYGGPLSQQDTPPEPQRLHWAEVDSAPRTLNGHTNGRTNGQYTPQQGQAPGHSGRSTTPRDAYFDTDEARHSVVGHNGLEREGPGQHVRRPQPRGFDDVVPEALPEASVPRGPSGRPTVEGRELTPEQQSTPYAHPEGPQYRTGALPQRRSPKMRTSPTHRPALAPLFRRGDRLRRTDLFPQYLVDFGGGVGVVAPGCDVTLSGMQPLPGSDHCVYLAEGGGPDGVSQKTVELHFEPVD